MKRIKQISINAFQVMNIFKESYIFMDQCHYWDCISVQKDIFTDEICEISLQIGINS